MLDPPEDYKVGSIRRICVRNFVTHGHVEVFPGPHLNMIVGPNGSGKSSVVAAIILGLGGHPNTIGRGNSVSEFVKHSCTEATIDIELHQANLDTVTITRKFTNDNKNTWKINDKTVQFKAVDELIKKYNIQVDNLCQFLPQDRVQDFAKMNKQDLLKNTQAALCRTDLLEKQNNLIALRAEHKEIEEKKTKMSQKLQQSDTLKERLENRVENLEQKEKLVEELQHVERKTAWLQYDAAKKEVDEIKKDETNATKILSNCRGEAKPIEKALANAKKVITVNKEKMDLKLVDVRKERDVKNNMVEIIDNVKRDIAEIKRQMQTKLDLIKQHESDLNLAKNKIEQLQSDRQSIINEHGDLNVIDQNISRAIEELKNKKQHMRKLEDEREEIDNKKLGFERNIKQSESDLLRFEDVKQQRLAHLRRIDAETYNAVIWFRQNKQHFKGQVFEPIMLEINVLNIAHSKFLENIISVRDRIAFTCELKDDMNCLIRLLRQQGISANVIHSGQEHPRLEKYQPAIPMDELRRFGMFAFVKDLIEAPELIMKYLCKVYGLHNIPVGTEITNKYFDQLPDKISLFFSNTHRFNVRYSRYTKEKTTMSNSIFSDGSFSVSLDTEKIQQINEQLQKYRESFNKIKSQVDAANAKIAKINVTVKSSSDELKTYQRQRVQIIEVEQRIKKYHQQLKTLSETELNKDKVKQDGKSKIKKAIEKSIKLIGNLTASVRRLQFLSVEYEVLHVSLQISRTQSTVLENKASEIRRKSEETEITLNNIRDRLREIHQRAKIALRDAKNLSENLTPNDKEFAKFQKDFKALPDDINELINKKNDLKSRIDCIQTADEDEVNLYQNNMARNRDLKGEIENIEAESNRLSKKIGKLYQEWITPVNKIVQQINEKFSEAFGRIDCAGEVILFKGENENDYSQYGLSIRVKYRDNEPMQELNRHVQSGGERAVATAVFTLALQEITPVPFRCVDEINQGMDAVNERKVFQLLVESMELENTPQYFLVTPKLVSKAKYGRRCTVHFVHNGIFCCDQNSWIEMNKTFIAKMKNLRQTNS